MTSFSLKKALWGHHRRNQLRLLYQSTFYQELERGRSFPYRSVESFPCFLLGTVPSENPTLLLGSAVAADMWQKLLPELGEISKRLLMSARDRHIEKKKPDPGKGKSMRKHVHLLVKSPVQFCPPAVSRIRWMWIIGRGFSVWLILCCQGGILIYWQHYLFDSYNCRAASNPNLPKTGLLDGTVV